MKKLAFFPILIATFGGVLLALQADKWLDSRAQAEVIRDAGPRIQLTPASMEQAATMQGLPDFSAAAKRVIPSVVTVDRLQRIGGGTFDNPRIAETGTGSGVIMTADGIIVTNNHVVQEAETVRVRIPGKGSMPARVLGTDPRSDLAVLKVEAKGLTPAKFADTSTLEVGDWAIAVGNPLGFESTVSVGVVSSMGRSLSPAFGSYLIDAIQTDAAINPGNSGGALTNANGELVGINSAIASTTGSSIGIGFSIPVNRVRRVVDDILKFGRARYVGLGISLEPRYEGILAMPRARAELAEMTGGTDAPSQGILLGERGVSADSPAARAGIKPFDVILAVDGKTVTSALDLNRMFNDRKPGERVSVKIWSRGQVRTVNVDLQELAN